MFPQGVIFFDQIFYLSNISKVRYSSDLKIICVIRLQD